MAEGSVLGAGAVLTKDTEPWMVYTGIPAKPIKMRNKELILENARKLGYGK
jgi:galactoside O-acetyltransferase